MHLLTRHFLALLKSSVRCPWDLCSPSYVHPPNSWFQHLRCHSSVVPGSNVDLAVGGWSNKEIISQRKQDMINMKYRIKSIKDIKKTKKTSGYSMIFLEKLMKTLL